MVRFHSPNSRIIVKGPTQDRTSRKVFTWCSILLLQLGSCEQCQQPGNETNCFVFILRRCTTCRGKRSLREGTFFAEFPRVPLGKLLILIYLWSQRELRSTASVMVGLTRNTVGRVYAMLRYYCKRDLEDRPVIPFGGRVFVVKCDESQFKHKSKVSKQTANFFISQCTSVDIRTFQNANFIVT